LRAKTKQKPAKRTQARQSRTGLKEWELKRWLKCCHGKAKGKNKAGPFKGFSRTEKHKYIKTGTAAGKAEGGYKNQMKFIDFSL